MATNSLDGIIRGDVALARFIFGDGGQRRLIPQLQREGWPIFTVAKKRCAFPDELAARCRRLARTTKKKAATRKAKRPARPKAAQPQAEMEQSQQT